MQEEERVGVGKGKRGPGARKSEPPRRCRLADIPKAVLSQGRAELPVANLGGHRGLRVTRDS